MELSERWLRVSDEAGREVCTLRIACESSSPISPIRELSQHEALTYGEEPFQLLESTEYEYELNLPDLTLGDDNGSFIRRSHIKSADRVDRGRIVTGNRTGRLRLWVRNENEELGSVYVEVTSSKIDYRTDYRRMLGDIAELSVDLVLKVAGPTEKSFRFSDKTALASIQQRLLILKGIIDSEEFNNSVELILNRPYSRLESKYEPQRLSKGAKISQVARSQLVSGTPRVPVPSTHPIAKKIGQQFTLPEYVDVAVYEDTLDVPENRLVKFILNEFLGFLIRCKTTLRKHNGLSSFIMREIDPSIERLQIYLAHSSLKYISELSYLPVASPVMQNRAGYRELLRLWIKSKSSIELHWEGLSDLYFGGTRDIAKLYEYWVFFKLWSSISALTGVNFSELASQILKKGPDGYSLRLKSGALFKTKGIPVEINGKQISIQLSYNRRFISASTEVQSKLLSYESSYPKRGSWTTAMQPDYTISLWPSKYTPKQAELNESMCHIHFDAKYRLNKLSDALGLDEGSRTESEKNGEVRKDFKRIDLLKMHSYKDAIRCSRGAYILYPGRPDEKLSYRLWASQYSVLPGLGAFCVRPGSPENEAIDTIRKFLQDVLNFLSSEKNFA